MDKGQVEYVAVPEPAASSSRFVKRPVIRSKRKTSVPCGPMSQKRFEIVSPVTSHRRFYVEEPNFSASLDREAAGSRRRSESDRRAPTVFEFAKKK